MLEVNKRLILDGVEYDSYMLQTFVYDLQTDSSSITVTYTNRSKHLKMVRDYRIKFIGDNLDIEDAINQVHNIHQSMIIE